MNKIKATKRNMKENYFIIGIGYCDAQHLLRHQDAIAYSSGQYGWACDYYNIDNVVISTGYSYIDNKNTSYDYQALREYERQARHIEYNHEFSYQDKVSKTNALLHQFIKECKDNARQ